MINRLDFTHLISQRFIDTTLPLNFYASAR